MNLIKCTKYVLYILLLLLKEIPSLLKKAKPDRNMKRKYIKKKREEYS